MARSPSNVFYAFNVLSQLEGIVFKEFAKSCHSNVFWINKKGLIFDSTKHNFNNDDWDMNPMQFCTDKYGERQYLYPIILMVNNVDSVFSFRASNINGKIITPSLDVISRLAQIAL